MVFMIIRAATVTRYAGFDNNSPFPRFRIRSTWGYMLPLLRSLRLFSSQHNNPVAIAHGSDPLVRGGARSFLPGGHMKNPSDTGVSDGHSE